MHETNTGSLDAEVSATIVTSVTNEGTTVDPSETDETARITAGQTVAQSPY